MGCLTKLASEKGEIQGRAVGALANMSRSDAAKSVLLQNQEVVKTLITILHEAEKARDDGEKQNDDRDVLAARATMALASLKGREESEENRVHSSSETLTTIVKCLEAALDFDKKMFGGVMWTVAMVLQPLYELSIADAHKVELVVSGVAVPLLRFVCAWTEGTSTHDLELSLLTLQQLSFDADCRSEIAAMVYHPEEQLDLGDLPANSLERLEAIVECDPSSDMDRTRDTGGSIGQLCKNLLNQLNQADQEDNGMHEDMAEDDKKQWIMISYNWDVQEQAKELAEILLGEGFSVWMDILEGCMGGDTLEAMATAVSKAGVVLMLVTLKYKESANCRREASYANDLKKPIVPIIMETNYKPDGSWGWLGLIIAGKLYYNLSDWDRREDQISELLRAPELQSIPKMHRGGTQGRAYQTPRLTQQASVVLTDVLRHPSTGAIATMASSMQRRGSINNGVEPVTRSGSSRSKESTPNFGPMEGSAPPNMIATVANLNSAVSARRLARRQSVNMGMLNGGAVTQSFAGVPGKAPPTLKSSISDRSFMTGTKFMASYDAEEEQIAAAAAFERDKLSSKSEIKLAMRRRISERRLSQFTRSSHNGSCNDQMEKIAPSPTLSTLSFHNSPGGRGGASVTGACPHIVAAL